MSFLHNHAKVIVASDLFVVVTDLGVRVLQTPGQASMANRRQCWDSLISLSEHHLRMTVKGWDLHYNRGRPHSLLGPGIPEPNRESGPASDHRHKLPTGHRIVKTSVLGGLHHECRRVKEAA